jgi:hypothetical protein
MIKHVISLLRETGHGGAIIFVPAQESFRHEDSLIDIKYQFAEHPHRPSFPELVVAILNRLAQVYGSIKHS